MRDSISHPERNTVPQTNHLSERQARLHHLAVYDACDEFVSLRSRVNSVPCIPVLLVLKERPEAPSQIASGFHGAKYIGHGKSVSVGDLHDRPAILLKPLER